MMKGATIIGNINIDELIERLVTKIKNNKW